MESRWYVAYTSPRHEKKVARQMEGNQVHFFLPVYRSVRRWKDRRKELELPLFPGYVFVHIALQDRMRVLRVPGVLQLVGSAGKPAPVADSEVEFLRRGLSNNHLEPHPYLKVGKKVQVRSGPMAGLEGILVRRKDKFRVVLSIHLIHRSVAVEVDENEVEPIR